MTTLSSEMPSAVSILTVWKPDIFRLVLLEFRYTILLFFPSHTTNI
jgi:hypothetical protein